MTRMEAWDLDVLSPILRPLERPLARRRASRARTAKRAETDRLLASIQNAAPNVVLVSEPDDNPMVVVYLWPSGQFDVYLCGTMPHAAFCDALKAARGQIRAAEQAVWHLNRDPDGSVRSLSNGWTENRP